MISVRLLHQDTMEVRECTRKGVLDDVEAPNHFLRPRREPLESTDSRLFRLSKLPKDRRDSIDSKVRTSEALVLVSEKTTGLNDAEMDASRSEPTMLLASSDDAPNVNMGCLVLGGTQYSFWSPSRPNSDAERMEYSFCRARLAKLVGLR